MNAGNPNSISLLHSDIAWIHVTSVSVLDRKALVRRLWGSRSISHGESGKRYSLGAITIFRSIEITFGCNQGRLSQGKDACDSSVPPLPALGTKYGLGFFWNFSWHTVHTWDIMRWRSHLNRFIAFRSKERRPAGHRRSMRVPSMLLEDNNGRIWDGQCVSSVDVLGWPSTSLMTGFANTHIYSAKAHPLQRHTRLELISLYRFSFTFIPAIH